MLTANALDRGAVPMVAGTTYDVVLPGRYPGPSRPDCLQDSPRCAGRVRFLLLGPDGSSFVAKSTPMGAARGPGVPDAQASTR